MPNHSLKVGYKQVLYGINFGTQKCFHSLKVGYKHGYVKRRNFLIVDKSHLEDVKKEVKSINEKYWDEERAKNINFVRYTLEPLYAKKILEKEKGGEENVD